MMCGCEDEIGHYELVVARERARATSAGQHSNTDVSKGQQGSWQLGSGSRFLATAQGPGCVRLQSTSSPCFDILVLFARPFPRRPSTGEQFACIEAAATSRSIAHFFFCDLSNQTTRMCRRGAVRCNVGSASAPGRGSRGGLCTTEPSAARRTWLIEVSTKSDVWPGKV